LPPGSCADPLDATENTGLSKFRSSIRVSLVSGLVFLGGCVYQPLYGGDELSGEYGASLSQIWVDDAETRVGQEVRNHLIFLLQGGRDDVNARYLARLRVLETSREFAAVEGVRDDTAGTVTVFVSYDLLDRNSNTVVAEGRRVANATYDRTSQNFANNRAVRDAQARAAKAAAEKLRLAFAADLSQ
jgi:LPS-assembly lipoprotein